MGFSLTGTHVVFFIVSVMVASVVSGVFISVVFDVNNSISDKGDRVQKQLDTDFKIINDNQNIPNIGGFYRFYLKNIGRGSLVTSNETFQIFIDGDLISKNKYSFSDTSISEGEITIIYVNNSEISQGDHKLRVVGPQAVEDEFEFEI